MIQARTTREAGMNEVDSRLRCDLSDNLYGQVQWLFDWDNTPAAGAERADHRLLLSVGYSF